MNELDGTEIIISRSKDSAAVCLSGMNAIPTCSCRSASPPKLPLILFIKASHLTFITETNKIILFVALAVLCHNHLFPQFVSGTRRETQPCLRGAVDNADIQED